MIRTRTMGSWQGYPQKKNDQQALTVGENANGKRRIISPRVEKGQHQGSPPCPWKRDGSHSRLFPRTSRSPERSRRASLGENRQVAQDHLFRPTDRRPGIVRLWPPRKLVIGHLDPFAVADTRLDLGPHRLAVFVLPAVSLLATMREGRQRQRPHAWPLDDHLGVGVHSRQKLAVGVGKIDLGPERSALDVQGPRRAGDAARNRLVAVSLGEDRRLGADVDVIGVLLGDVDEDADDIGAVDHVNGRGAAWGQVGRALHCRGVARGRQDEVESVGIAGRRSRRRRGRGA